MARNNNSAIVPSSLQPIANNSGHVTPPWLLFFNNLVRAPNPIVAVTVTASPFAYTASAAGSLLVSGGTVSARTLTRSGTTAPTSASTIQMANGDIATITYSVAPTINFVPG